MTLTSNRRGCRGQGHEPSAGFTLIELPVVVAITAFFDGHVQPVRPDELWQFCWHVGHEPPAKRSGLP
jgi:prepilin-type N-terminal cleavage/methylation domain-containing protein